MRHKKIQKNGFALTEVLLSILVITFIGIGAYVLYSKSRDDAQIIGFEDALLALNANMVKSMPAHFNNSGNEDIGVMAYKMGLAPNSIQMSDESNGVLSYNHQFDILIPEYLGGYPFFEVRGYNNSNMSVNDCVSVITALSQSFLFVYTGARKISIFEKRNNDGTHNIQYESAAYCKQQVQSVPQSIMFSDGDLSTIL